MDPVSAVGVAAAAVQFLDASIKAYNTFQEIRTCTASTTKRNEQLEDDIRYAQSLRASSVSTSIHQGATDGVSARTARCISKGDELLTHLTSIRDSGNKFTAFCRAMYKRDAIEKLYSSLKEDQDTLNHMISQKLLPAISGVGVQQSKEFADLNSIGQRLINEFLAQNKVRDCQHAAIVDKLDVIQSSRQMRIEDTDRSEIRKRLLESLWFPEIDQRQSEIKEPAPDTLDWLFAKPSHEGSSRAKKWSNFRQWLSQDTSTYWISGKAGSGKSTLMAHIVDDRRTRKELEVWSSGHRLEVLSFFFWRAGSRLQNSVLGLLRSLLYQLCSLQPAIADTVVSCLSSPTGMMPTWTERTLLHYASEAIKSSQGLRFCIFIDGLDEYTGTYGDLVDYIDRLRSFRNAKFCISSRPELEFVEGFRDLKKLRLQDLNFQDIENFVMGSFKKAGLGNHRDMVDKVARRAEGVFLWASLVTQSLIKGAKAGDDDEIMRKRLDSLPGDMNRLFERMLSDIDPAYRTSGSLAFYIRLMKLSTELPLDFQRCTNIAMITTAQLKGPITSYQEFVKECGRTETQITTQSAGLLEIVTSVRQRDWRPVLWINGDTKYVSNRPCFTRGPEGLDRRRCTQDEPYAAICDYEYRNVQWVHRSAFEFLSNPESVNTSRENPLFEFSSRQREELFEQIGNASISYLIDAPSVSGKRGSWTTDRMENLIRFISQYYNEYPAWASSLLDKLYCVCTRFNLDEFDGAAHHKHFNPETHIYTGGFVFWIEASRWRIEHYILSRMDRILEEPACDTIILHILTMISYPNTDMDIYVPRSQWRQVCYNSLAGTLVQRLGVDGVAETAEYKCIAVSGDNAERYISFWGTIFHCATWKETVTGAITAVMIRLVHIVGWMLFQHKGEALTKALSMPESLSTFIDMTDLYVAPNMALDRLYIQFSAKSLIAATYSMAKDSVSGERNERSHMGRHASAFQVPGAVRILCVPLKTRLMAPWTRSATSGKLYLDWESYTELEPSKYIAIQPSITTSDCLLELISYIPGDINWTYTSFEFRMDPSMQKRQQACMMLLQDVKSVEQGLDGGQQLIAAACIRAGFLHPIVEQERIGDFQVY